MDRVRTSAGDVLHHTRVPYTEDLLQRLTYRPCRLLDKCFPGERTRKRRPPAGVADTVVQRYTMPWRLVSDRHNRSDDRRFLFKKKMLR